jgi:hypothetical protein
MMDAAKTGGINGTVLALGESLGRGVLGPGLGTAAGGVVSASALSGADRDTAALVAVERGMSELFGGAMASGNDGGGSRRRM